MDVIDIGQLREELNKSDVLYYFKEIKRITNGIRKVDKMNFTKEKVKLIIAVDDTGEAYITDSSNEIKCTITKDAVIMKSYRNSYIIKKPDSMVFIM